MKIRGGARLSVQKEGDQSENLHRSKEREATKSADTSCGGLGSGLSGRRPLNSPKTKNTPKP